MTQWLDWSRPLGVLGLQSTPKEIFSLKREPESREYRRAPSGDAAVVWSDLPHDGSLAPMQRRRYASAPSLIGMAIRATADDESTKRYGRPPRADPIPEGGGDGERQRCVFSEQGMGHPQRPDPCRHFALGSK